MTLQPEPLPIYDRLVDKNGLITDPWLQSWTVQRQDQQRSATVLPSGTVLLTAQNASIGSTVLSASITAGLYRVTYQVRKTTADGVSSSITVSFGWPDLTQALTFSGAALTTDAVTAWQSGTFMAYVDDGGPVTYSTTYASNTAGLMKYALRLAIERISS